MDVKILCWIFLFVTTSDCWKEIEITSKCYKIMENADCSWLSSEEICSSLLQAAVCDKVQSCVETTWSKFSYDGHCDDETYLKELKVMRKDERYKGAAHDKQIKKYLHGEFSERCADEFDDEEEFDKCIKHFRKLEMAFIYLEASSLDMELICRLHSYPCVPLYDIPYQSDKCDICMLAMNRFPLQLSALQTAKIKAMCSEIAPERVQQCNFFVKKYAHAIAQLQSFKVDPNKICALMDVCPTQTNIKGDECFSCNLAMNLIQRLIERAMILRDCDDITLDWREQCQNFTKSYYRRYLPSLMEVDDWDVFCDDLTSCQGQSTSIVSSIKAEKTATDLVSTNKCEACLTAMHLLKSNQQFVNVAMEKECKEPPITRDSLKCQIDADELVVEIMRIIKAIPSPVVCQTLNLCPVNSN